MRISDWSSDVCSSDLFAQPAFGRQLQPVGDMVAERAMDRAIGHAALRAARRLFLRLRQNELARDFQKIIVAFPGGAFLGIALSGPDKAQHLAGSHKHLLISEEHTSELHSLMLFSYSFFCFIKN